MQQSGEHVICTAGELHLERCLRDLKERFAKIPLSVSKPIVAFRECFVAGEKTPLAQLPAGVAFAPLSEDVVLPQGRVTLSVANGLLTLDVISFPLPETVIEVLSDHGADVTSEQLTFAFNEANSLNTWPPPHFASSESKSAGYWTDRIWQYGPNRCGANILFRDKADVDEDSLVHYFRNAISTGFQLATAAGPLMAEPVSGLAICLLPLSVNATPASDEVQETLFHGLRNDQLAVLSGQLITSMKEVVHRGCLEWSPRLGLAMYDCDIRATSDVLGKVYDVLSKRRGKILSEEMMEGTSLFQIKVLLPVVESFGFADGILVFHPFYDGK